MAWLYLVSEEYLFLKPQMILYLSMMIFDSIYEAFVEFLYKMVYFLLLRFLYHYRTSTPRLNYALLTFMLLMFLFSLMVILTYWDKLPWCYFSWCEWIFICLTLRMHQNDYCSLKNNKHWEMVLRNISHYHACASNQWRQKCKE